MRCIVCISICGSYGDPSKFSIKLYLAGILLGRPTAFVVLSGSTICFLSLHLYGFQNILIFISIAIELELHGPRALTICVFVILPNLGDIDGCLSGSGIGQKRQPLGYICCHSCYIHTVTIFHIACDLIIPCTTCSFVKLFIGISRSDCITVIAVCANLQNDVVLHSPVGLLYFLLTQYCLIYICIIQVTGILILFL